MPRGNGGSNPLLQLPRIAMFDSLLIQDIFPCHCHASFLIFTPVVLVQSVFSSSAQSTIKYFVVGPITNVFLIERLQPLGWGHILGNGWKRSCSLKVSSPDSSPAQYLHAHYSHFQREKARSVSRYFTQSDLSMQIQLFF